MKKIKIISILLLGFCLIGCGFPESKEKLNYKKKTTDGYFVGEFVYQGCQYISAFDGIAHKGNCTNSIHIYKAER